MLWITTRNNKRRDTDAENIHILCPGGDEIIVTGDFAVNNKGHVKNQIMVGIKAPRDYKIYREEIVKEGIRNES